MTTTFLSSAAFDMPVWLAACGLAALLAVLVLVGTLMVLTLRRADQRDLPQVLLGLSHVVSSLCGLLPWGRPTPPPGLPEVQPSPEPGRPAMPSLILMQAEPAESTTVRRVER